MRQRSIWITTRPFKSVARCGATSLAALSARATTNGIRPSNTSRPRGTTSQLPTDYKPEDAKRKQVSGEAIIQAAKRIQDWPSLDAAVEEMIADQTANVAWWREKVSKGHGGDRQVPRSAHLLSYQEGEQLIGFRHQTISKWDRRLGNPEEYAAFLRGPSYSGRRICPRRWGSMMQSFRG